MFNAIRLKIVTIFLKPPVKKLSFWGLCGYNVRKGGDKRHLCTAAKNYQKTVTKHIWWGYVELAEDIRHTPKYIKLYEERKEKIERVFADAKEKHAMRYTPYRGLTAVRNWVRLKFAAMDLKKLAIHKEIDRKRIEGASCSYIISLIFMILSPQNSKLGIQYY